MFVGVSMPWQHWLIALFLVVVVMMLPMLAMETLANLFPEPVSDIVFLGLAAIVWPFILCWLYSKKLFATGQASIFFWFYVIFYIGMGLFRTFQSDFSRPNSAGEIITIVTPFIDRLTGAAMATVGVIIFIWSRKVKESFNIAVEDTITAKYDAEREG